MSETSFSDSPSEPGGSEEDMSLAYTDMADVIGGFPSDAPTRDGAAQTEIASPRRMPIRPPSPTTDVFTMGDVPGSEHPSEGSRSRMPSHNTDVIRVPYSTHLHRQHLRYFRSQERRDPEERVDNFYRADRMEKTTFRNYLVDKMFDLFDMLEFKRLTLYLAVRNLDFLITRKALMAQDSSFDTLELYAVALVSGAIKYNEEQREVPPVELLQRAGLSQKFTPHELFDAERRAFTRLGHRCERVCFGHYMGVYTALNEAVDERGDRTYSGKPPNETQISYLQRYLQFMGEVVAHEYAMNQFPGHQQAAAICAVSRLAVGLYPLWPKRLQQRMFCSVEELLGPFATLLCAFAVRFRQRVEQQLLSYLTCTRFAEEVMRTVLQRSPRLDVLYKQHADAMCVPLTRTHVSRLRSRVRAMSARGQGRPFGDALRPLPLEVIPPTPSPPSSSSNDSAPSPKPVRLRSQVTINVPIDIPCLGMEILLSPRVAQPWEDTIKSELDSRGGAVGSEGPLDPKHTDCTDLVLAKHGVAAPYVEGVGPYRPGMRGSPTQVFLTLKFAHLECNDADASPTPDSVALESKSSETPPLCVETKTEGACPGDELQETDFGLSQSQCELPFLSPTQGDAVPLFDLVDEDEGEVEVARNGADLSESPSSGAAGSPAQTGGAQLTLTRTPSLAALLKSQADTTCKEPNGEDPEHKQTADTASEGGRAAVPVIHSGRKRTRGWAAQSSHQTPDEPDKSTNQSEKEPETTARRSQRRRSAKKVVKRRRRGAS